jgi:hypothetical protein
MARAVVTRHFKLVFIGVLLLTVFLWLGAAGLSLLAGGRPEVAKVADGFLDGAKLCTGGAVGLLGGKALR